MSAFFAWNTVHAPESHRYIDGGSQYSVKLSEFSWPFFTDILSHYWYHGYMVIWFIDKEHTIVERVFGPPGSQADPVPWIKAVNQEFFHLLTFINVVGGVLGLLVSWGITNRLALKASALPNEPKLAKLTLLGISFALILFGILSLLDNSWMYYALARGEGIQTYSGTREVFLGSSILIGLMLFGIATLPRRRDEKNLHQKARACARSLSQGLMNRLRFGSPRDIAVNTKILLRFFIVLACLISILSTVTPFLHARPPPPGPHDTWYFPTSTLWSFMRTDQSPYSYKEGDLFFGEYWSRVYHTGETYNVWVAPVLVLMFEGQIVTVLFAALAAFRFRPLLLYSSTTLAFLTILSMWFINTALYRDPVHEYVGTFQIGFWLTFLSAALFSAASLMSSRPVKKHE